ncbi:CPBP family glutamic-type intramembrane protease [Pontibacter mangrovi]|uniref:CPBP family intramembrane metalloprotease n=1 Tax=Pontibacter mangrovi TaxID=2589816 RepID=A0A501W465_9BACT|nr:CPBP family glutamic-type intramembrane protease [Pontibacter mangrovi]TPE44379.1 CPBP family intramembrane metalloprotease [Pontibacter mangrovi]
MKTPTFFTAAPPCTPPPPVLDTLKKVYLFARQPKQLTREHNVLETKLPLLFQLTFAELILRTGLFTGIALIIGNWETFAAEYSEGFAMDIPLLPLFVSVVLLAPLTEEVIFRLPLVYSHSFLLVAALTFLFHFCPAFLSATDMPLLYFAAATMLVAILGLWYLRSAKLRAAFRGLWEKHFGTVFYTSTALFALMHLLNYRDMDLPLQVLPLLVLPKFIGGFFLGYTRLRLGFGWAVGQHAFNNLISLILLYGYLMNQ